ncbi:MAG: hypothetical protein BWY37_02228 [Firmicutes bacterium ADurb.Bin262]|nr:MAG: hypothetical protein BWY37_02228 [Firmicutes bacterium ADurb.Bin262]
MKNVFFFHRPAAKVRRPKIGRTDFFRISRIFAAQITAPVAGTGEHRVRCAEKMFAHGQVAQAVAEIIDVIAVRPRVKAQRAQSRFERFREQRARPGGDKQPVTVNDNVVEAVEPETFQYAPAFGG